MELIPINTKTHGKNDSNEPPPRTQEYLSRLRFIEKITTAGIGLGIPLLTANILSPIILKRTPQTLGKFFPRNIINDLTNVSESTYSYGTKDSNGHTMDTLKVIPVKDGYVGVYHYEMVPGSQIFDLALAFSEDLQKWQFKTLLINYDPKIPYAGSHATMPDIAPLPNGGFLLAFEKDNNKIYENKKSFTWMEIKYYKNLADLLNSHATYSKKIPHTRSNDAEGTPNIDLVQMENDIEKSLIQISFHYNDANHIDNQAVGVLKNLTEWTSVDSNKINNLFRNEGIFGNIGGRNFLREKDYIIRLQEAQSRAFDWKAWGPYLLDPALNNFLRLELKTHKGSTSSGNHKSEVMIGPNGKKIRFNSYFIFSNAAAEGEAGQLIFYKEIEKRRSRFF